ncbi:transketolase [Anaerofustis sp. NSJ-163]|nr:transketolase [Anaerofustis sp. NSJ-163]
MDLKTIASNVRVGIITEVAAAQSGHPGGSLSSADIVTYLYFEAMNINKDNLDDPNRDKFILSKGHASPVLYAALAEKGIIERDELKTFRKINTRLQGHPAIHKCPGVDMTAGSLGLGFPVAVGLALGNKIDGKDSTVYCLCGDGEIQEGSIWEAAMAASHYKLDNLILYVDNNNLQIDGPITDVMSPYPIDEKFAAFGFNVINVEDGHDFDQLREANEKAKACKGKPSVIVCKTVKGKGVSFMENQVGWHGKAPSEEQAKEAIEELGGWK